MGSSENINPGTGKKLDDLFRDAIGKQEITPSLRVWRNLNWKLLARELTHFNFTNVGKPALVAVSGGVILVASLVYWALTPGTKQQSESTVSNSIPAIEQAQTKPAPIQSVPANTTTTSLASNGKPSASTETSATRINARNVSAQPTVYSSRQRSSEAAIIASKSGPSSTLSRTSYPTATETSGEAANAMTRSSSSLNPMDPLTFESFDLNPLADTMRFAVPGGINSYIREKAPVPSFFSANLGISPEMAVYSSGGSTTTDFNYWISAGLAYHFSRFSVRTGLGLGLTYDEGSYKIQYISNDSVNYYKEVIGYVPDPDDPSKIIYYTKNHTIYDSVTHLADDRTRNRYTYLQVPLLLGYNVLESPRFILGIEAGPAFTVLLGEKKAQPVVEIPNGRLILMQDNTPPRTSFNWQLWARLSIGYQFTKNWGLFVNPYYKYYLTSPVQKTENGKQNSQAFGIDVGIQYLFGRKSPKK